MRLHQTEISLFLAALVSFPSYDCHPELDVDFFGIDIDAFTRMFHRECETELKLLESTRGIDAVSDIWRTSTDHAWYNHRSKQTFLLCNVYPQLSGFQRREELEEARSVCAYMYYTSMLKKIYPKEILGETFFNDDTMTCDYAYIDIAVAQCIATKGIQNISTLENNYNYSGLKGSNFFRVQPLLPMMKIAQGTVSTVENLPSNTSYLFISFETVRNGYESFEMDRLKLVNTIDRKNPLSRFQLLDTFPFTGRFVECSDNIVMCWNRSEDGIHGTVYANMTMTVASREGIRLEMHLLNQTNMIRHILAYLAHFASYPCIKYIEITSFA